jgi:hypothetical protein
MASSASRVWSALRNALYRLYQQIGAFVGAVGIAAILKNLSWLDWRGWPSTLIGHWNPYVRPLARWLIGWEITWPLQWIFGWHVELPLVVEDYVAVGVFLTLAFFRASILRLDIVKQLPQSAKRTRQEMRRHLSRDPKMGYSRSYHLWAVGPDLRDPSRRLRNWRSRLCVLSLLANCNDFRTGGNVQERSSSAVRAGNDSYPLAIHLPGDPNCLQLPVVVTR